MKTIGINAHLSGEKELSMLTGTNINWIRIDINWHMVESKKGYYNWDAVDRTVHAAKKLGLNIFATIAYAPKWANGGNDPRFPATDLSAWLNFVSVTVARYCDISYLGAWNEPDCDLFFVGSKESYVKNVLIPFAAAVKQHINTFVVAPGIAGSSEYLKYVLDAANDYIDVISIHVYADTVCGVINDLEGFKFFWSEPPYKKVLKNYIGKKPIWITEIGWATKGDAQNKTVSEDKQKDLYERILKYVNKSSWIDGVFFYELKDSSDPEIPAWGILRSDNSKKKVFEVLNYRKTK